MPASGDADIEMQLQYAQTSTLTMPGGDLHDEDNPDPPNGGSEDPSLARRSSRRSFKRGRSRKSKSPEGPSRSGTPSPRTSASPQDNNVVEPINVAEPSNGVQPTNVIKPANTINIPRVTEGDEVTTDPKPVKTKEGAEEEWTKFAGEVDKHDRTMMETTKDSIDSLLVFAGLFSAIVTAFCILSLALLQPDSTDSTAVILAQISLQLGSLSIDGGHITSIQPPYTPPARFRATRAQITVNALLFSSLILALIAASLGIIVKQWMREYAAPTSSQTLEHVCIRQYRFDGLRRWRVDVITRLLPLLLQVSLLLFFAGLSILLWTVSNPVAAVGTVLVAIWLLLWATSICLSTFYADCPYKSAESTIFFTLSQVVKSVVHAETKRLGRYLWLHIDRPKWLKALCRKLSDIDIQSYGSWRDQEKAVVQKDMERLIQRTIFSAHEISMDESMLEVAMDAYVKSSDVDKRLDVLLKLFSMVSGCSEADLDTWLPDGSRRTCTLIRITLDALAASNTPLQSLESSSRTRRELLLGVIGRYFYRDRKDSQSEDIIRQLLDLPLHLDLLGASSQSLAAFTRRLGVVRSKNHIVKIEAIESIARCAMHAYDRSPEDCQDFLVTCCLLLQLLNDSVCDEIISHEAGALIHNTNTAISKAVAIFNQHPSTININRNHLFFCEEMHKIVEKHPALKHVMRDSAMAYLQLFTHPNPDMPLLQYGYPFIVQRHQNALNALWGLYHDCPPPPFPLIHPYNTASGRETAPNASETSPPPPNSSAPAS